MGWVLNWRGHLMRSRGEPEITYCHIRCGGDDDFDIECRFSDGQKLAAITVDGDFPNLAGRICAFLNASTEILGGDGG